MGIRLSLATLLLVAVPTLPAVGERADFAVQERLAPNALPAASRTPVVIVTAIDVALGKGAPGTNCAERVAGL